MARRTAGRKAYRVLDFITALYDPDVQAALAPHGFGEQDIETGWELFRRYGRARRAAPGPSTHGKRAQQAVDAWENRWFVIAEAALSARYPKVHAWLFNKLTRQSGSGVLISVPVLIDRVRQLERGDPRLGKEAAAARKLLSRRGLTEAVLEDGERRLAEFKRLEPIDPERQAAPDVDAAEAALWAWYLEWSRIARAVIDEPRLLSHLGLGKPGRPKAE